MMFTVYSLILFMIKLSPSLTSQVGNGPDTPSPTGTVNRVVQGVVFTI